MSKTIAKDCGMPPKIEEILKRAMNNEHFPHTEMEDDLCEIIGALYRRIEKLEEELEAYRDQLEGSERRRREKLEEELEAYRDQLEGSERRRRMNINTPEDIAKVLASPKLNDGEKSLVKWQYHQHGGFGKALWEAISKADHGNLFRMAGGFPQEVQAYIDFSETGLLAKKVDAILKELK